MTILICNSNFTALSSSSNGLIDKSGNKGYQHARTLTTLTTLQLVIVVDALHQSVGIKRLLESAPVLG